MPDLCQLTVTEARVILIAATTLSPVFEERLTTDPTLGAKTLAAWTKLVKSARDRVAAYVRRLGEARDALNCALNAVDPSKLTADVSISKPLNSDESPKLNLDDIEHACHEWKAQLGKSWIDDDERIHLNGNGMLELVIIARAAQAVRVARCDVLRGDYEQDVHDALARVLDAAVLAPSLPKVPVGPSAPGVISRPIIQVEHEPSYLLLACRKYAPSLHPSFRVAGIPVPV